MCSDPAARSSSSFNARRRPFGPQLAARRGAPHPGGSIDATIRLAARVLPNATYWRGCGYVRDPVHGGLIHYNATRRHMTTQLEAAGFKVVEIVGSHVPHSERSSVTPWYYYACRKMD